MSVVHDAAFIPTNGASQVVPTRMWKKLLALCSGLLLGLVIAELAVRRWVVVRNVGPSFTVFDPTYDKRLKTNFSCERITPEFRMRLTTNSLGFRGPEPGPSDARPILFIGDSFTMGYGVNDGEEYPAVVRQALAERFGDERVPVINAGIGDVGTGRWVRFLRGQAVALDPGLVVLQICGNDFEDNVREGLFRLTGDNSLVEQRIVARPFARYVQECVEAIPWLSYSHLICLVKQLRLPMTVQDDPAPQPVDSSTSAGSDSPTDRLTHRLVSEIIDVCRRRSWPLLVLLVDVENSRREALDDLLKAASVPFVRFPTKNERPELYFRVDGHWNEAGHALAASLVLDYILRRTNGEPGSLPSPGVGFPCDREQGVSVPPE